MTKSLLLALCLLPAAANAAIDLDDPGDSEPTPTGGSGGGDTTATPPAWEKTYTAGGYYGDSDWGAGYSVRGRLAAYPKTTIGTRDKLEASASLGGYAKFAGYSHSLFSVAATGVTQAKSRTDVSFTAYIGGAAIYTKPYSSATSTYVPLAISERWPRTFVDKTVNVAVGPVPVTFRVQATGELAATLSGKISNVGIEFGGGPSGKASLYASAAVGGEYCLWGACVGASAGVYASVTLVEASAKPNLAIWWSLTAPYGGIQLNYLANAGLTLKTLDGELGVFASACLGGCLDWSSTLIDWPGITSTWYLINATGKYCLTGTCTGDSFQ